MTCTTVTDELSLLLSHLRVLEPAVVGLAAAQNHSNSRQSQFAGDAQGPFRCSPAQAADKPTDLTVYTFPLLLLRPAIERDAECGCWSNLPRRVDPFADGKVARGGGDVVSCTKGFCYCCIALADLGGRHKPGYS